MLIPNMTRIVEETALEKKATPPGWCYEGSLVQGAESSLSVYRNKGMGLVVMFSLSRMDDGSFFVHVSLSRRSRLPSWEDVKVVKNAFLGEDSEAFHVLPKKADYINLHPYCLHLWQPIEENDNGPENMRV